jgi:predicted cytidylate kinase
MAVIRVSGNIGSGKSTLCERLAGILKYKYHYNGGVFRMFAAKMGLPIHEFYKKLDVSPTLEKSIDADQERLMLTKDDYVVEGRIAPFQKCAFKAINVKITASLEECARRLAKKTENSGKSLGTIEKDLKERIETERARYFGLYGIEDHLADDRFDIVIDTTNMDTDKNEDIVLKKVLEQLERFQVFAKP